MNTIESMVESVVKRLTTSDLGDTKLRPEKFASFIKEVEATTPMLQAARRINMSADKFDLDRIGLRDSIFGVHPTKKTATNTYIDDEGAEISETTNPTFSHRQLSVVRLVGAIEIPDEIFEDNLEGEGLENTVLALMGERAGRDLEYIFLRATKRASTTDPTSILELIDGWLTIAASDGHAVAGQTVDTSYNAEATFDAMLDKLVDNNPEFLDRRRQDYTIWTSWKIERDYRKELKARGTDLGDRALADNITLAYEGIPIRVCTNMPTDQALLAMNDNLVWGVRRDVRIEPERKPRYGRTDFIITARVDAEIIDPRGVVVCDGYGE